MTKEFVPYELSLKLKQLGYQDGCMAYYTISLTQVEHEEDGTSGPFGWKKGEVSFETRFFMNNCKGIDGSNENWLEVGAPLFQQAFRWFREQGYRYSICSCIDAGKDLYYIDGWIGEQFLFETDWVYQTYEEAELACLEKLIEIVESKKEEQ